MPLDFIVAIVDDDDSVRAATQTLLRSLGYPAVTFPSAEAFLSSEYLERVACLITDIRMPGMTGIQLQCTLQENGKDVPVIFMTAYPEGRIRAQVMAAGAIGCLGKPFVIAEMVNCLMAAIQRRSGV